MRYTVVWLAFTEATLAKLWIRATDRQAVSDAADRIDVALSRDPETKGTPLGNFFVREDDPLSVLYQVDPGDRMVRVIGVKRMN